MKKRNSPASGHKRGHVKLGIHAQGHYAPTHPDAQSCPLGYPCCGKFCAYFTMQTKPNRRIRIFCDMTGEKLGAVRP